MHLRGLGQFDVSSMVSAESLIKSGLQYAANTLIFAGVGTVAGLAVGILTYFTEKSNAFYAANWNIGYRIDVQGNIAQTAHDVPEGVTNELDPVDKAIKDSLRTYAKSADDLGFMRLPFELSLHDDASYATHEFTSDNFGTRWGGDYATNMTRAILDPLLASFSVYPSVERIRASTPDPGTLTAEQCKDVIKSMYAARADDVIAYIKAGTLDQFRAQAETSAAGAAARFQACQDAKRAALMAMTGADLGGMPGGLAFWEEQQWRQEQSQYPAYKNEPWTVVQTSPGGFDYMTGQEATAATYAVVTGPTATAVIEEQSNPFANWFEMMGST